MIRGRDLPLLVVFAAVARRGSFTAAARELGVAKSVVSEQLRALEERCGARLVERTTRRLRLTQVGDAVLAVAANVLEATRDLEAVLEEHRDSPTGTLRVATTHDLAHRFVAPTFGRLAARHPQLKLDLVSDDAPHDLVEERFDVAVRLGAPRDSSLVMRKLAVFPEIVVAAPIVAASFTGASRPRHLEGARWVRHALVGGVSRWKFRGPRGETEEIAMTTRAQANTGDGVRALVLAGAGVGVLPEYQVADDVRRGALMRLIPQWIWRDVTLHALLPSARRTPKRAQLFVAALVDELAASALALR